MSPESRKMSGVIFITVPSIIYGGYFLLGVISGQHDYLNLTDFQKAMFRAGHAHAGVLVILSLLVLLYVDETELSSQWKWVIRIAFPLSAILVSMGFFAAATGNDLHKPNAFIFILYAGMIILAFALVLLGIGLLRKSSTR
ncbi:MAG: hypothetical protein JJU28_10355 [Cyclobacteriaceae bacterium]|nr:hypothetical protein [Cyclobacteriaceae bacterium]